MSSPDLSLLPALVALLEEQSVSLAAARTGISQPAMSRTLQRLRVVVGDELLVKAGRGLLRTHRGDALLHPARAALSAATSSSSTPPTFSPSTATGTVTVALGDDLQAVVGGAILLRLRALAPGLDVRLRMLGAATADEARRGVVDVALIPLLPAGLPPLDDFVLKPLWERRFVTVSKQRRRLGLDAFCAAEHLLVSPGGTDAGYVDDSLRELGRRRRVAVTVHTFAGAIELLKRSTTLVSTLPEDVVRILGPTLHAQRCPVATPRFSIALAWLAQVSTDPRHRFVRDVVRAAVADVIGQRATQKLSAFAKQEAETGPRDG
jgi:DNA-binding transcriptional LysR family regulator